MKEALEDLKMTKKKQILLAIVGTLAIGSGVWFAGSKVYEEMTAVKVQDKIEKVCRLNGITRIEFKDDTLVTLENQDGLWKNAEYSYLPYDQEAVASWVEALMTAETTAVVKNAESEEAYGIREDGPMITVFDGADKSETYRMGDLLNGENKIYLKKDNEDEIFIVAFEETSLFQVEPNQFVDYRDKLNIEEINKVSIKDPEGKEYIVSEIEGTWYLEGYYAMPCVIKEEEVTKWLDSISAMKLTSYVGTSEQLESYGLEEANWLMTVNDNLKLRIGKQTVDAVYVAFEGEQDVYTIDRSLYQSVLEAKLFDMLDKNVLHLSIEEVSEIEMKNPQATFVLKINDKGELSAESESDEVNGDTQQSEEQEAEVPVETPDASSDLEDDNKVVADKQEKPQAEALLNDKVLSRIEAEEYFNLIKESLVMEVAIQNPEIEQKEDRKAECTMRITLKNGEVIMIELVPYDINYYILRYNGTIEVAVNKEIITKLFTSLARTQGK